MLRITGYYIEMGEYYDQDIEYFDQLGLIYPYTIFSVQGGKPAVRYGIDYRLLVF